MTKLKIVLIGFIVMLRLTAYSQTDMVTIKRYHVNRLLMDVERLDLCDSLVNKYKEENLILDSLVTVQNRIINTKQHQVDLLSIKNAELYGMADETKQHYSDLLKTEKRKHLKTKLVVVGQSLLIVLLLL